MNWLALRFLTRVRRARPRDMRACAALYCAARRRAYPRVPADRFTLDDFALSTRGLETWVADCHDQILGFVSFDRAGREIAHLYVTPDLQGRGVGRRLLTKACRLIGEGAVLECDSRNQSVVAFYQALGWVEQGPGSSDEHLVLRFEGRRHAA